MIEKPFLLDGTAYNVRVKKLTRKFSILDSSKTGRTQNGAMYRDVIGTYYNYSMVVEQYGQDQEALDSFWEAVSQPDKSHVCVFPYNQETLTQQMYVTSGEQDLMVCTERGIFWGEMTLNFIAMRPRVTP